MVKEYCKCCGQAVMKHRQTLSKALCGILMTAVCKFPEGQPFHLQRDINLSKTSYANFQKLRYWGLVKKSYDPSGKRANGMWELTTLVKYFVNGKELPAYKYTFNNSVVESSEEMITLESAIGSYELPQWWAEKAQPMTNLMQPSLFETTSVSY